MSSERWERVKGLVDRALSMDGSTRERFLDEACGDDEALRAEVQSLLRHQSDSLLESQAPAADPLLGRTLGHYRIEEEIGRGGMGRVYRARDLKLGRDVAVKALPESFASNLERVKRFEREARLVAALNHPNVATIHGLETIEGTRFLVLELVDGETMRERLLRGPLGVETALRLAAQVANALQAAHEAGVVHRDLKPGNVKVTPEGSVKVLDFGLAKELRERTHDDSTNTAAAAAESLTTKADVVLGTPSYMSPEQVGGSRGVDHRTDVWSFGVMLWEMLVGERPFGGASIPEILGAVLHAEPRWERLPPETPPPVRALLRRCLTRESRNRLQAIGEARIAIDAWLAHPGDEAAERGNALRGWSSFLAGRGLPWLIVGLGLMASPFVIRWVSGAKVAPPLLQSVLPGPPGAGLEPMAGFALSPDGSRLAFVARAADGASRLWVRPLAALQARPLAGTEGAGAPFWSPDGRDIGFFADRKLKRVPAAGGAVRVLAGPMPEYKGGTWSPDGRIVYGPDYRTGLFEVPDVGGEPRAVTTLDAEAGELSHRWPQFLPDGRTLLFLVQTTLAAGKDDRSRVEALDAHGDRHQILRVNASVAFAPPGWLLFWRENSVHAQEFDPDRLQLRGEPRLLAAGVGMNLSEWASFSVSGEKTLVYAPTPLLWRLEWRDRSGRKLSVAAQEGQYRDLALSPDGRQVAYVPDQLSVRIRDLARGTDARLTFEEVDHYGPAWDPHGDWVAYSAGLPDKRGTEISRRRSSRAGEREVLYSSANVVMSVSWSPDDRWIAFEENEDVRLLDLAGREVRDRIATPALERTPTFSSDGRWLAYVSDESGRDEIYVVPVAAGPERWQISSEGGYAPHWGPGGNELFFRGLDSQLNVVQVQPGETPRFGLPEPLFTLPEGSDWRGGYDVGPDGRLLVVVPEAAGRASDLKLVVNWPKLLERAAR